MSGDLGRADLATVTTVALLRRRWIALGALLGPLVAIGMHASLPRTFKAQAEVLVEDGRSANPFLQDMVVPFEVKDRLPIIQAILRSETVLERVLKALGTVKEGSSREETGRQVRSLRRRIEVFGVGGGLVRISLMGPDANDVKRSLDVVVNTFVEEMLRPQTRAVEDSTVFLSKQLDRLRGELASLEAETALFKSENASELPEVYKVNLDSYLSTQKAHTEAQMRLENALRKKQLIEEQLRTYDPATREVESVWVRKKAELQQLRALYTETHPKVAELQGEVASLKKRLDEVRGKTTEVDLRALEAMANASVGASNTEGDDRGLKLQTRTADLLTGDLFAYRAVLAEIEGARGEIELLERRLATSQQAVKAFAQNEQTLTRLVRESETKATVYKHLLEKYEDAIVTRELSIYDEGRQVWIIDPPTVPAQPMGQPLAAVAVGACLGAMLLVLLASLALELVFDRVRTAQDAARLAGAALLAVTPRHDGLRRPSPPPHTSRRHPSAGAP